jgi:hypothetical protein
MTCEECLDLLAAAQEETGPRASKLEAHLRSCPACAAQAPGFDQIDALLSVVHEAPPIPPGLAASILQKIAEQETESSPASPPKAAPPEASQSIWEQTLEDLVTWMRHGFGPRLVAGMALLLLIFLPASPLRPWGTSMPPPPQDALPTGVQILAQASNELLRPGRRPPTGVWLEALDSARITWPRKCTSSLTEGSVFRLGEHSLELRSGTLAWTGHPTEDFRVRGGEAELLIVGTTFTFTVDHGKPTLDVLEGVIQVTLAGKISRVAADLESGAPATWSPSPAPTPKTLPPRRRPQGSPVRPPPAVTTDVHYTGGGFTSG